MEPRRALTHGRAWKFLRAKTEREVGRKTRVLGLDRELAALPPFCCRPKSGTAARLHPGGSSEMAIKQKGEEKREITAPRAKATLF